MSGPVAFSIVSRALGHAGTLGGQPHGIRVHRYPLVLLGLVALSCSALLLTAIALRPATEDRSNWLFDVTNGPHVAVSALPGVDLRPVIGLPGSTSSSGPFPGVETSVRHGGEEVGLYVEARPTQRTAVDRPAVLSGGWLAPRAIVLQRTIAHRLAVTPGDRVRVTTSTGRLQLRVAGVADTTLRRRYPGSSEGIGYVLPPTLSRIAPNTSLHTKTMVIRLADPDAASAFARSVKAEYPGPGASVYDWRRP